MPPKRKKILYVITKSNLGGAQRYVLELATSLPSELYEVVVAFGGDGQLKTKLEEAGIRTRTIKSFERDINIRKEFASMRELSLLIKEEKPNIVHLNSSKAGGSGALIARLGGVKKIIFTAHGWPFYESRGILWRIIVWFLSYLTTLLSHRVIVVSRHDLIGSCMWGQQKKLSLVNTALPPILFRTRTDARASLFTPDIIESHKDDVWLVSTGEHTKNKNIGSLLRALSALKDGGITNFFLTIMSDGEERQKLEVEATILGLGSSVHFTGFIPEARTYLTAFDVFLLPSLKEGLPYGLLEAGVAGLASIVSDVGGTSEVVTHKKSGLLIEPYHEETLRDAIATLLSDEALRWTYGTTLKSEVENTYTLPRMVDATRVLYGENGSWAS